ncbi:MAG: cation-translocating P-type ATPase, partial [Deltaproteobacteria bacterium]|nr:cation-translocating P-type ATPase [Deltaproteobacteria bacterium]
MRTKPTIVIKHEIPGRLRLKVKALKGSARDAVQLDELKNLEGLLWLRVNPVCASLVLAFDPETLAPLTLLDRVRQTFHPAQVPKSADPDMASNCACPKDNGRPVRKALIRFVSISAVFGAAVIRESIFKASVAQTIASPLGLAGVFFSLPLIVSGVRKLKEKRLGLEGFLAAGTVTAIAAGEAMTAFEILWINSGAELLSAWIAERSRKSIAEILEITSHHTFVLVDGVEVEKAVEDVRIGDIVVLHGGEKISVDGIVVHGEAEINEAPLTGREEVICRGRGERVFAGTFVHRGVIRVEAARVGDNTYLARVMRKVQDSLENRAPIEGVADTLARNLVKVGLATTAATFVVTGSAWRAFTVLLVMACPCATVLSASTAISAAISAAAKKHVLIKGGRYLEEAGKCDTVCFDKTGTLTNGHPELVHVLPTRGIDEQELLRLAVSAEAHNHHP